MGFRIKTFHKHIYENQKKKIEIIFLFAFWNKNFKRIGFAKARLL